MKSLKYLIKFGIAICGAIATFVATNKIIDRINNKHQKVAKDKADEIIDYCWDTEIIFDADEHIEVRDLIENMEIKDLVAKNNKMISVFSVGIGSLILLCLQINLR